MALLWSFLFETRAAAVPDEYASIRHHLRTIVDMYALRVNAAVKGNTLRKSISEKEHAVPLHGQIANYDRALV